jgi:hypothetical protein
VVVVVIVVVVVRRESPTEIGAQFMNCPAAGDVGLRASLVQSVTIRDMGLLTVATVHRGTART